VTHFALPGVPRRPWRQEFPPFPEGSHAAAAEWRCGRNSEIIDVSFLSFVFDRLDYFGGDINVLPMVD